MIFKTIIIISFLIAIDQITKYLAYTLLMPIGQVHIIEGLFSLTYVENRGAAFGILQGARWFFIVSTMTILIGIFLYCRNLPKGKPFNYIRISMLFITAGAIGNLIDRVLLGYVIDFLHITFINFPVFNIADIYVVMGTISYSILLIFFDEAK